MTNTLILNKLKALQRAKNSKTKYWNITWTQGVFLSNLIEIKQPKEILEIGTSNGFSTLWMALNLPEQSHITTVEINKERFEIAKNIFKQCNLNNIKAINEDIQNFLPTLNKKFDLIFMDAKQEFYLDIIKEIEKLKILNSSFTIIIDNITTHEITNEFTQYMQENYSCDIINIGGGFLIAKQK